MSRAAGTVRRPATSRAPAVRPSDRRRGERSARTTPTTRTRRRRTPTGSAFYRRLFTVVVITLLGGTLGWVVWFSPVLAVHQVRVEGVSVLRADTVRDAAGVPADRPLARVDLAAAERRVEQLPVVASATVSRSWPDTIVVRVVERTPVVTVAIDNVRWVVDRTGTVYLPVANLPDGGRLPPGVVPLSTDHPGPTDRATKAAIAVWAGVPASLKEQTAALQAPSPSRVTLALADGRSVVWGGPDRSADKARLIGPLLAQDGTVFDVSTPDAVVVS